MAFTKVWAEDQPAATGELILGDDAIRDTRIALRERLAVDHNFKADETGDAFIGRHNKVSFIEQAALGTGAEGKPILGAQTADGKAELVYVDEDDNKIQMTKGGVVNAAVTAWTPVLEFGGGTTGITYSMQVGKYTRIGTTYILRAGITLTSKGSSTGIATITGLPAAHDATARTSVCLYLLNVSYANAFQGLLDAAASEINLQEITEGGVVSNLTDADFANDSRISLFVVYNS